MFPPAVERKPDRGRSAPQNSIVGTVPAGLYVLEVGASAGTAISPPAQRKDADPQPLARALKNGGEDRKRRRAAAGALADGVAAASQATAKAERAVELFKALAEGKVLDAKQLSGEIDAMLDLLERLDREGRLREALRLARALSGLLALLMRWAELVRSLNIALHAAEKVGDLSAVAWARHELGTLHLAAGDASTAERELGEARELRQRLGDRRGLGATERNLQVLCQRLRRLLRAGRLVERSGRLQSLRRGPAVLALAAAALLVTAGVAVGLGSGGDGNGDPTAVKHPGHKAAGQKPHRENPVAQRRTAQSIDRESTGGQRPGGQQPDRAKALGQKPSGGTPPGGNPLPDLTVESLKADVQPRPGCQSEDCFVTMVNFTIRNAGAAEVAVSFQVLIRVDGIEKRITVRGLAGDASVPLSEELAAGANCFKADCTVQVTVDSGDAVAESNETNNTGGADLQRWPLTGRSVSISVMRSPLAPE